MKKYNKPQVEILSLSTSDIVTASNFADGLYWSQGVDMQSEL